jgi:ABC-type amino acid transport substrate-binding protein
MRRLLLAFALLLPAVALSAEPTGVLAKIKSSGTIRLGYLGSAPPFSFVDGGTPAGYSVDICRQVARAIAQQLHLPDLRAEWVRLTEQDRLAAVRSRKVDVECGTTTWTLSRQELVDFSLMTFIDGGTVLARSDADLVRLQDFAGKRIGVVPGTTTQTALQRALKTHGVAADVVTVASPERGIEMLSGKELDGYASDRMVLLGLGTMAPGATKFALLEEDFSVEPYALTLPRGEHDLRLAVNRALAALYRSGEIEPIFERWLGPLGRPSMLLTALYYLQGIPE